MAAHWSKDHYTLWWRDHGTLRARVSFAKNKESLLKRLARVWHDQCDPALYAPDGSRLPLSAPTNDDEPKPRPKKKKPKAKKAKAPTPQPQTALVA